MADPGSAVRQQPALGVEVTPTIGRRVELVEELVVDPGEES
jgi:hypothetical protein